jgi:hypothetical protein
VNEDTFVEITGADGRVRRFRQVTDPNETVVGHLPCLGVPPALEDPAKASVSIGDVIATSGLSEEQIERYRSAVHTASMGGACGSLESFGPELQAEIRDQLARARAMEFRMRRPVGSEAPHRMPEHRADPTKFSGN